MPKARSAMRANMQWNHQPYPAQHANLYANQHSYQDDPFVVAVPVSGTTFAPKARSARQRQNANRKKLKKRKRKAGIKTATKPAETRTVACWTSQQGTEPPRYFFSDKKWANQRRIRRGQPDEEMPLHFRGATITAVDLLAQGASLEPPEDAVYCEGCGGLVIVRERHEASLLHLSRLRLKTLFSGDAQPGPGVSDEEDEDDDGVLDVEDEGGDDVLDEEEDDDGDHSQD